jgi:hypothetical protein
MIAVHRIDIRIGPEMTSFSHIAYPPSGKSAASDYEIGADERGPRGGRATHIHADWPDLSPGLLLPLATQSARSRGNLNSPTVSSGASHGLELTVRIMKISLCRIHFATRSAKSLGNGSRQFVGAVRERPAGDPRFCVT